MEKTSQKKKWIPWVALALAAAVLAGLPMLASGREQVPGVQASVKNAQAEERDINSVLVGGGQVESSGVYNVKIPENVKIKEFIVGNGDPVSEGDPIARIDPVSVMTAITEVQNTLNELSDKINEADGTTTSSMVVSKPAGRVKKIYAQEGDSVEDVMLQYGSLAVISLDDVMAVKLNAQSNLRAGDNVTTEINGKQVTGRVRANAGGEIIVTVSDNQYEIGTEAAVFCEDGTPVGTGALYVYNEWNATAYSGTVSYVNAREQQTIYAGQTLFTVKESGKSAEYQRSIDKRQNYEALMQELFKMYSSGVITAPCDGIVSGIDKNGTYMLSTDGNGYGLILLDGDVDYQVKIITDSLPTGQVGVNYYAVLVAAEGDVPVSGTWTSSILPKGLYLDQTGGGIYGTPTVAEDDFKIDVFFKKDDGETAEPVTLTLNIEKKEEPQEYKGYLAQVTVAGGNIIKVKQNPEPYTITDLEKLPSITPDVSTMTEETTYEGQAIASGNFAVGDNLWVVFDKDGNMVKAVKISGGKKPDGGGGGFGGMSGMPAGADTEEDDGLYSLEKVTVATVTSQESMTVSISIDELDITKVYVGQKATITMNAFAEEPVEAVVKSISNSGENEGGNSKFTVELELEKSSRMLPGMNATATITLDTAENVLSVPAAAVYELDGNEVVYTAYDEKAETLINPVTVTTGRADADYVEILSGLSSGMTVYYEVYESFNMMPKPI